MSFCTILLCELMLVVDMSVCRPLSLGGLGIHNLEVLGWALNLSWLWLKKTQPDRPWTEFNI
jgi:hypothetical protein